MTVTVLSLGPANSAGLFVARQSEDECRHCVRSQGLCWFHAKFLKTRLKQPYWYFLAKSGDFPESFENGNNVRSRQRHERKQRVRRLMRLQTATTGARVGRNSTRAA